MASIVLPNSVPDGEKSVWIRVIAKRRGEVEKMKEADVEMLLEEPIRSSVGEIPSNIDEAISKFDWVLRKLIFSTVDPTNAPATRRDAYRDLKILLSRVENTKSETFEMALSNTEIEASESISQNGNGLEKIIHNYQGKPLVLIGKGNQDVQVTNAPPSEHLLYGVPVDCTRGVATRRHDQLIVTEAGTHAQRTLPSRQDSNLTQRPSSSPLIDSRATSVHVSDRARNYSTETISGTSVSYGNDGRSSAQNWLTLAHPVFTQAPAGPALAFPMQTTGNSTHHGDARPRVATNEYKETSRKGNNCHREPRPGTTVVTSHNRSTGDATNSFAFLPPQSGIDKDEEPLKIHHLHNRQSDNDHSTSELGNSTGRTAKTNGHSIFSSEPLSDSVRKPDAVVSAPANRIPLIAAASTPGEQDSISQPVTAPLPIQVTSSSSDVPSPKSIMVKTSSAPLTSIGAFRNVPDSNFLPPAQNGSKHPLSSSHRKQSSQPLVIPQIPTVQQPSQQVEHKRWFAEALPKFTGALGKRPLGEFSWKQSALTEAEVDDAIRRLYIWDPYWEMLDILALTKNSSIDSIAHMDKPRENGKDHQPPTQNRAVEVKIAVPLHYQKLIKDWNRLRGDNRNTYEDGDVKLVLRMLPCQPPQRPTGKSAAKKKLMRSDYHLWPKGTFIQVDHVAREIVQRKQQSHNVTEWSYLCRMLDVTQFAQTPATVTITGLFHDPEPYYLCAAICRYRAPLQLYRTLMNGSIDKLSMEDSIQVALEYAQKNAVVCLDDGIENDNVSPSSFVFKLSCPISSTLMTTPVRGRQCNHFQCFDLQNFLTVNANISGTRWECPVCNDEVISTFDLELCALTEKLLTQYKSDASLFRDRVQFFSDGTWKLMPEKRKRYLSSNSDANQGSIQCSQSEKLRTPEIVIL